MTSMTTVDPPAPDRTRTLAWVGAIAATVLSAVILLQLALNGLLLIQGIIHGLPYRISFSVGLIIVFGVALLGPATAARLLWSWLYRRADPATVTTVLLLHILVFAAVWPAMLAKQIGDILGR
jgi:drug/metabolite transporter (DMT)-like permease